MGRVGATSCRSVTRDAEWRGRRCPHPPGGVSDGPNVALTPRTYGPSSSHGWQLPSAACSDDPGQRVWALQPRAADPWREDSVPVVNDHDGDLMADQGQQEGQNRSGNVQAEHGDRRVEELKQKY